MCKLESLWEAAMWQGAQPDAVWPPRGVECGGVTEAQKGG